MMLESAGLFCHLMRKTWSWPSMSLFNSTSGRCLCVCTCRLDLSVFFRFLAQPVIRMYCRCFHKPVILTQKSSGNASAAHQEIEEIHFSLKWQLRHCEHHRQHFHKIMMLYTNIVKLLMSNICKLTYPNTIINRQLQLCRISHGWH